jgi:biopolymer transport protein TolQ
LTISWCYSYILYNLFCGGIAIIFANFIGLQVPSSTPAGSSIFEPFKNPGSPAFVILLLLALFSLLSWTIIFRKWLTFRHISRQSRAFIAFFRKSARLSEVESACEYYRGTPLSGIFNAGYQELNAQLQTLKPQNLERPVLLERNITGIQRSLQRAAAAELSVLEKNMSWLATTGSVSPFIGLLGTVIGIINAFNGLGLNKTASIQAVAPGISEALIATAAGLFAAIPAVIAYNQFISRIKNIAVEMDDFSSEFLNLVERSFS